MIFDAKKKRTRREVFLAQVEKVITWSALEALIAPNCPKEGGLGRHPVP